jgi:hypothetical protein
MKGNGRPVDSGDPGTEPAASRLLPVPVTGEAIDLAAPDDELLRWIDRLAETEAKLREFRTTIVAAEVMHRMDRRASWTLRAGEYVATAPSPDPATEWDIDALRSALANLVADGTIDLDAALECVQRDVTYKPRVGNINRVKKISPDVAAKIDACSSKVERNRRVTVKIAR